MGHVQTIRDNLALAWDELDDLIEPVTINRIVTGAYDPATSTHAVDPNLSTSFDADALPDEYQEADFGSSIHQGDVRIYLLQEACDFTPTNDHKATFRGAIWGIENVKNHAQSLYEIQLRRAV
jgi:hypothetical protein